MICNNEYLAGIFRVFEIKDLILVMRFYKYIKYKNIKYIIKNQISIMVLIRSVSIRFK